MGLTVAEVFILLSFILMLLLVYWKEDEQKKRDECEERAKICANYPDLDPKIVKLVKDVTNDLDADSVKKSLTKVANGARLIEEDDLKKLISAVESLPPVQRNNFIKLVSAEGYQDVIEWANKFSELKAKGYHPKDLVSLIEEMGSSNIEGVIDRIRSQLQSASAIGESIAGEVNRAVGELVGSIGGAIDNTSGAVTLPDTALFEKGSSELSTQTKNFLNLFCAPWIKTLAGFEDHIQALRIEGHASSEWDTTSDDQEAFLKNMSLSQARASAVLDYCLQRVSDSDIGPWARSKIIAVGYSSAKPIIEDEKENAVKSRRVVFRPEADSIKVLEEIEKEVARP